MTDDYNENDHYEPDGPVPEWIVILDGIEREAEEQQVSVYVPTLPKRKRKSRKKVRAAKRTRAKR